MSARNRRSTQRSRRPSPTRRRNSRRAARPGFREAILGASKRAKQRANRRLAKREKLTPVHAATAGAQDGMLHLSGMQRAGRWMIALLLLPLCYVATVGLLHVGDSGAGYWRNLVRTPHFLYFGIGAMLMMGWFFTRLGQGFFLYLYVFGHELTHAGFVYLCGGKVSQIHVAADGGYIMTNKSNFLIALSPYFVPFWTVVVLLVSTLLDLVLDIPYHEEVLYGFVGATWTFHILWTLWMIPRDQPDLIENDVFFSIVVIYLVNILIISGLLLLAPGSLTWHHWYNVSLDAWFDLKKIPVYVLSKLS